jgi:CDGSH-type Zn-finger protein
MPNNAIKIHPLKDGPLQLEGEIEFVNQNGETIATKTKSYLCRCGASANKPFCDGQHKKIDFRTSADEG